VCGRWGLNPFGRTLRAVSSDFRLRYHCRIDVHPPDIGQRVDQTRLAHTVLVTPHVGGVDLAVIHLRSKREGSAVASIVDATVELLEADQVAVLTGESHVPPPSLLERDEPHDEGEGDADDDHRDSAEHGQDDQGGIRCGHSINLEHEVLVSLVAGGGL